MKKIRWWVLAAESLVLLAVMTVDWASYVPVDAAVSIPKPKYVALTFDDGPYGGTTDRLLDGLAERGVPATFFLIGEQAERFPELVERMAAEGHQVGNHTMHHVRLSESDDATVRRELTEADTLLRQLLGEGDYWVRVPYGLVNDDQRDLFDTPLIQWSVDPEDWRLRDADAVTRAVTEAVEPGDIILLHDSVGSSVDAALQIVDELQRQGYTFLTVRDLLAVNGVTPENGVRYRSVKNIGTK